MVKILACCSNGSGTSLMMSFTLNKLIEKNGFKVSEATHKSISEGRLIAKDYDIVLCPMNFVDMFKDAAAAGTKIIGLRNVMSEKEMTEKLENCGVDLKG